MNRLFPSLLLLALTACDSSDNELRLHYRGEWREFDASDVRLSFTRTSEWDSLELQGRGVPNPQAPGGEFYVTARVILQKGVLGTGSWSLPIRGHTDVPATLGSGAGLPTFQPAKGHSEGVRTAYVDDSCGFASPQDAPAPQFLLGRLELTENRPGLVAGWLELTMDGQVAGSCGGGGLKLVHHFQFEGTP